MPLRKATIAVAFALAVFAGWRLRLSEDVAAAGTQTKAGPPSVNPEVLAFLAPVELEEGDSELGKKKKERFNAAAELLKERVSEYESGARDLSAVFEAARMVADSKVDLAETAETRVAALEQVLRIAGLMEDILQQQAEKGFGSKGDLARARFARLSVEVELLKARGGGNELPN